MKISLQQNNAFIFWTEVKFSKYSHCESVHHPIVMVLQNRHYVSNNNGELIMCLLALFDKQDANDKSSDLKDNVWQQVSLISWAS